VKALILAGGKGTRLRPLTCRIPKPMIPVVNRPLLEHTILLLKKHGIKEIGITMMYMPKEIENYFKVRHLLAHRNGRTKNNYCW